jgi:Tol biopolymer transport system component
VWSHDDSRFFFTAGGGIGPLFEQSSSGPNAELLLKTGEHNVPSSASPDGRFLLYTAVSVGPTRLDLWVLPLEGERKPFPFLRRPFDQRGGQFSPDGRWVAYVSNESGRDEVLVRPFTSGPEGAVESSVISKGGGMSPRWRGDGKEIFYLTPNGTVTSVSFGTDRGMEIGPPKVLFQVPGTEVDWAVTRSGERFLLAAPAGHSMPSPFTVVFNWQAALNK